MRFSPGPVWLKGLCAWHRPLDLSRSALLAARRGSSAASAVAVFPWLLAQTTGRRFNFRPTPYEHSGTLHVLRLPEEAAAAPPGVMRVRCRAPVCWFEQVIQGLLLKAKSIHSIWGVHVCVLTMAKSRIAAPKVPCMP